MATSDGSLTTIPRPRPYMNVCTVPRSTARSSVKGLIEKFISLSDSPWRENDDSNRIEKTKSQFQSSIDFSLYCATWSRVLGFRGARSSVHRLEVCEKKPGLETKPGSQNHDCEE